MERSVAFVRVIRILQVGRVVLQNPFEEYRIILYDSPTQTKWYINPMQVSACDIGLIVKGLTWSWIAGITRMATEQLFDLLAVRCEG